MTEPTLPVDPAFQRPLNPAELEDTPPLLAALRAKDQEIAKLRQVEWDLRAALRHAMDELSEVGG